MKHISPEEFETFADRDSLRIIVGLGNPGCRYSQTRHNVGRRCVERLALSNGMRFHRTRQKAAIAAGQIAGVDVVLAKPGTYMNLSGQPVVALVRRYRLDPAHLLVIYDDIDLPLGAIRLRPGGGSGGHKGMQSIIDALGSAEFMRLRIGIGRSPHEDPADYVLGRFAPEEMAVIESTCALATKAVECYLSSGIESAMNEFNN